MHTCTRKKEGDPFWQMGQYPANFSLNSASLFIYILSRKMALAVSSLFLSVCVAFVESNMGTKSELAGSSACHWLCLLLGCKHIYSIFKAHSFPPKILGTVKIPWSSPKLWSRITLKLQWQQFHPQ